MENVSCIVTFHNERYFAHSMLTSLKESYASAAKCKDVRFEFLFVLDNADNTTSEIVRTFNSEFDPGSVVIYETSFGDPALSRNYGIKKSEGKIISIFDGDDLYSSEYLERVVKEAIKNPNALIHPEILYSFGKNESIVFIPDSNDIPLSDHYSYNPYQSSVTANRKIFERCPYAQNLPGIGYEDWTFNCDVLAAGFCHKTAPGAIRFYRCGNGQGVFERQKSQNCIVGPSSLWD
jgi:glycosyltransferase involved in cell wall biosynthesis